MNLREHPVIKSLAAPNLAFVMRQEGITNHFLNDLKFFVAVPAHKYDVAGLKPESVTPCHSLKVAVHWVL